MLTHRPPFPLDPPLPISDYRHIVACGGGPKVVLQNSLISAIITGGLMSHGVTDKGAFCESWGNARYLSFQAWYYNAITITK